MIIVDYKGAESALEPQLIVLGTESERIFAALGMTTHLRSLGEVMLGAERAEHTGSWSLNWMEAVERGIHFWETFRNRFTSARLDGIRRNGAPRENLARCGTAVATELGLPADDPLVALLAVAMIRREEFDDYVQKNAKGART
ncbi:hypothetical protein H340_03349 [Streptomyces mobaraensis NBRC 13819 = DSM 40847]|uniref:Uncharacterized protein n=2 Tax=Streptomyces mobaraensis TaxID=35621 RepID=M3BQN3_STRM1|nr:hypothetical protein H340_03349 [Streptomyces mobaraensis NBRC 13819 = DSM 40847]